MGYIQVKMNRNKADWYMAKSEGLDSRGAFVLLVVIMKRHGSTLSTRSDINRKDGWIDQCRNGLVDRSIADSSAPRRRIT